jgi:hypothetical protein
MPGLPHADIADLGRRITTLRERIVVMVHEGQQTRDQSEQLIRLLKALKAAKTARALELARLSKPNSMHKPVAPVSTAYRVR